MLSRSAYRIYRTNLCLTQIHVRHTRQVLRVVTLLGVLSVTFSGVFCDLHLGYQKGHGWKKLVHEWMVDFHGISSCTQIKNIVPGEWGKTTTPHSCHGFTGQDFRASKSTEMKAKEVLTAASKKWCAIGESMFGGKKGTRLIVEMLGDSWEDSLMSKFVQNMYWIIESYGVFTQLGVSILGGLCHTRRCLKGGINHLPKPRLSICNMEGCKITHHVNA